MDLARAARRGLQGQAHALGLACAQLHAALGRLVARRGDAQRVRAGLERAHALQRRAAVGIAVHRDRGAVRLDRQRDPGRRGRTRRDLVSASGRPAGDASGLGCQRRAAPGGLLLGLRERGVVRHARRVCISGLVARSVWCHVRRGRWLESLAGIVARCARAGLCRRHVRRGCTGHGRGRLRERSLGARCLLRFRSGGVAIIDPGERQDAADHQTHRDQHAHGDHQPARTPLAHQDDGGIRHVRAWALIRRRGRARVRRRRRMCLGPVLRLLSVLPGRRIRRSALSRVRRRRIRRSALSRVRGRRIRRSALSRVRRRRIRRSALSGVRAGPRCIPRRRRVSWRRCVSWPLRMRLRIR